MQLIDIDIDHSGADRDTPWQQGRQCAACACVRRSAPGRGSVLALEVEICLVTITCSLRHTVRSSAAACCNIITRRGDQPGHVAIKQSATQTHLARHAMGGDIPDIATTLHMSLSSWYVVPVIQSFDLLNAYISIIFNHLFMSQIPS